MPQCGQKGTNIRQKRVKAKTLCIFSLRDTVHEQLLYVGR